MCVFWFNNLFWKRIAVEWYQLSMLKAAAGSFGQNEKETNGNRNDGMKPILGRRDCSGIESIRDVCLS